jgi:hypothetical protein
VADSAPGDVEDGVGGGGRDAGGAEFADALAAKGAGVGVMFVDDGDVDWGASAWVDDVLVQAGVEQPRGAWVRWFWLRAGPG